MIACLGIDLREVNVDDSPLIADKAYDRRDPR
jgi:hypothetical protein